MLFVCIHLKALLERGLHVDGEYLHLSEELVDAEFMIRRVVRNVHRTLSRFALPKARALGPLTELRAVREPVQGQGRRLTFQIKFLHEFVLWVV